MHKISKTILETYQVRKTKKQKTEFITFLQKELAAYGYDVQIDNSTTFSGRNLIIGDLEKAKLLIGAHYDTCAQLPFPNYIAPMNMLSTLFPQLLIGLLMGFLVYGLNLVLVDYFMINPEMIPIITFFLLLLFLYMIFWGKDNPHTVNDNTSGILTTIEVLTSLKDDQKEEIAVILFDHEEQGLFGSRGFYKKHKAMIKDKLLINFDCVSDGDYFLFVSNLKLKSEYEERLKQVFVSTDNKEVLFRSEKNTYYPSDQKSFKQAVGVAALNKNKRGKLYMSRIHTKNDVIYDERNIEILKEGVISYLTKTK